MPYINAAQISGNLGKDAETMTTQGGRTVTRFSIASTKKRTDKANKTHESTDWFRVAVWGNLTKFASSLKKGDPILVQGELRTGEYTDEKKVTRQTVEIVAQTILRIDYTKPFPAVVLSSTISFRICHLHVQARAATATVAIAPENRFP